MRTQVAVHHIKLYVVGVTAYHEMVYMDARNICTPVSELSFSWAADEEAGAGDLRVAPAQRGFRVGGMDVTGQETIFLGERGGVL
jgi:hypothetical protein